MHSYRRDPKAGIPGYMFSLLGGLSLSEVEVKML
jgi:hypothetical protein